MTGEKDQFKEGNHHCHEHGHHGHKHDHHGHEHDHHCHEHDHHGHEHDHHGHEHDHHDHGHDYHGHEHGHHDHEHGGNVSVSHHEGAVIGAMQGVIPGAGYDEAEKLLAEQMREAGRLVTEAGGIIGHIKFIVSETARCGQISVTDIDENIKHFEGGDCRAEGVAIVFAVDDDKLTEILTDTIGKILKKE